MKINFNMLRELMINRIGRDLNSTCTIGEYSESNCGFPELTTRRNPNPSILKLFYGSDTMLRKKEYTDSH